MLRLFATGTTRGLPPCMAMEETGAPYELTVIDIRSPQRPEAFNKLQLQGRLPALIDGDLTLDQSVAIMIYIAECFGVLMPRDRPGRFETLRMLMVAATDVMFGHATVFRMMRSNQNGELNAVLRDYRQRLLADIAKCETLLRKRAYLAGGVTIADFMLYAIVGQYDQEALRLSRFNAVADWVARLRERPSVRAAERACPFLYDVSGTLGSEPYDPRFAARRFIAKN